MGLAGGMIGAFWWSKGNPFWMMSGGLAGIFICAGGLDIWYPGFAFILGTVAGCVITVSYTHLTLPTNREV